MRLLRVLMCCAALGLAQPSRASTDKNFGVDLLVGVPHLLNVELSYLGLGRFAFGLGFGTFPVDSIINSAVTLPASIAVDATYSIIPSASYSLLSANAFARWYPLQTGLFLQLAFVNVTFKANVRGALRNNVLNTTSSGAISGSATVNQGILNLVIGYEKRFDFGFFFAIAGGAGYPLVPSRSISIGGSAAAFAAVSGNQAEFDAASAQITDSFNNAIDDYHEALPVLPSLTLTLGWAF